MELEATLQEETRDRYLTYALSVVSGRALPDVRDGLKPVQRRILFAMYRNLGLRPDRPPRKSAKVVGEVIGSYHPHGDSACYEAMVRMAQDFSLRYPLVEGQGNFGSLDGDSPAAYRYTEARLRPLALELIGEIDEEAVDFRDNFDGTSQEPVVLPSRFPNLLVNGASGIAVGMATNIPPHNLKDTIKALLALSRDPDISTARLTTLIKGPDFPTGCAILNSKKELEEMYRTGRGAVKMRGMWEIEHASRGKRYIVITAIPYGLNKSVLVEKIATLIIARKVPQLVDIRDESTEEVRVVLELASGADPEPALAYLCKHTPLECNFNVNLTVLVPSNGALKPELASLRECLQEFFSFREEVVARRLQFELRNLQKRVEILEGFVIIFDALDEAIAIVRKSKGRADAALRLRQRFTLSERQSLAIVDMRVYQLSGTNILEVKTELKEKNNRISDIKRVLADPEEIAEIVRVDLEELAKLYGERRRSLVVRDAPELEFNEEDFVIEEEVYAIVSRDGWVKRIRQTNDYTTTRLREGDELFHVHAVTTLDYIAFFTSHGYVYSMRVTDFPSSGGFGTPIQKLLKFRDGERIVESFIVSTKPNESFPDVLKDQQMMLFVSASGQASASAVDGLTSIKRSGRRVAKLKGDDVIVGCCFLQGDTLSITKDGFALRVSIDQIPQREGPSLGVNLISLRAGDRVAAVLSDGKRTKVDIYIDDGRVKTIKWSDVSPGKRTQRGTRIVRKGKVKDMQFVVEE